MEVLQGWEITKQASHIAQPYGKLGSAQEAGIITNLTPAHHASRSPCRHFCSLTRRVKKALIVRNSLPRLSPGMKAHSVARSMSRLFQEHGQSAADERELFFASNRLGRTAQVPKNHVDRQGPQRPLLRPSWREMMTFRPCLSPCLCLARP